MRARQLEISTVVYKDRNPIEKFLTTNPIGPITDIKEIDQLKRATTLLKKNEVMSKRGAAMPSSKNEEHTKKRELKANEKMQQRIDKEKTMTVNDFILDSEVRLASRWSAMQNPHYSFEKVMKVAFTAFPIRENEQRNLKLDKIIQGKKQKELFEKREHERNKLLLDARVDPTKYSVKIADITIA